MTVHLFGIRHHGPGSARSLRRALGALQPDLILIEGPPDADALIPLVGDAAMQPPVALLVYNPDQPQQAAWYPFALFSPEWQALAYAHEHGIPAQFMDLPQRHMLAWHAAELAELEKARDDSPPTPADALDGTEAAETFSPDAPPDDTTPNGTVPDLTTSGETTPVNPIDLIHYDPISVLAQAAGFADGERWWEQMVEERQDDQTTFDAIQEAMIALRAAAGPHPLPKYAAREALREAWMRTTIRTAEKQYSRIVVVCGAWHVPALLERDNAKADKETLKKLPAVKTAATWAPWTYSRLARASGYGAGIESPGWYHHLWVTPPPQIAPRWLARVAELLRREQLNASTAQVIDAVRLVEALAALRDRPLPGLDELNEASIAVLCQGNPERLHLIHEQLIVSETLGNVPPTAPAVPLQRDLETQQKRLRLKVSADTKSLDLDLRQATDLARSHLFHRLALLGIPWAAPERSAVRATGTFHEYWRLRWEPEAAVALIEANIWGNTVLEAADQRARQTAADDPDLPKLMALLNHVLLAALPQAAEAIMAQVQQATALTSDTGLLMDALPGLVEVLRYGNVRQTDVTALAAIVDGVVARIAIGLPAATATLDDDAAAQMVERINRVHGAIELLQNAEHSATWLAALDRLAQNGRLHGLVAGRVVRLLRNSGSLMAEQVRQALRLALSPANDPAMAAAWIEGFLKGSGEILLHDDSLWQLVDGWIATIPPAQFEQLLPLLRRTFATFGPPVRRRMGERARQGNQPQAGSTHTLDHERAGLVLPLLRQLLGLPTEQNLSGDSSHG